MISTTAKDLRQHTPHIKTNFHNNQKAGGWKIIPSCLKSFFNQILTRYRAKLYGSIILGKQSIFGATANLYYICDIFDIRSLSNWYVYFFLFVSNSSLKIKFVSFFPLIGRWHDSDIFSEQKKRQKMNFAIFWLRLSSVQMTQKLTH